ncbi:lipase family protein [Shewanella submarina]|uniref:Lipase family protein n=1 Tax=Shewanella submarina TaxID=2016376 RepID=A0ABV7GJR5_9GAMM|nr:lipase family protein [Shewanella submarina]MCL1036198.1 lipase family protein [Shewanella submarina]
MTKKVSPYKTSIDSGNAYWMARLSKLAYINKSDEDNTPCETEILAVLKGEDSKFIRVKGYNNKSSQGLLVEHEEYICMAFRGTDEPRDWLDNINAFSTKVLFGDFHRGFWNALDDIWNSLKDDYDVLMRDSKRPLFITGHSLGGAMATIAAAKFIHEDIPFTSVYTFGQPRVMSRETSRVFNMECQSRFHRFHNNNDLVTRVPARLMGYSHVGSYLYITEEKEIHAEPGFWFRFVDHVDGAVEALKEDGIDVIEDHDMSDYLDAVEKWNYN